MAGSFMKTKSIIILLGVFILVVFTHPCFADVNTSISSQNAYDSLSIEEKLDKLVIDQNQNIIDSARSSVDTANLVIGVVTLIFTVAGIFGIIGGIVFTSRIQDIEANAKSSERKLRTKAEYLEVIIMNAEKLEKEIKERAEKSISLYEKWEIKDKELALIEEGAEKLSGKSNQQLQLAELQEQIKKLKRDISRNMPSYPSIMGYSSGASVYPGSVSTSTSTSTSSSGAANPGAATPTTFPYYPSPSTSPSPEDTD
jgi:hypothetical protein